MSNVKAIAVGFIAALSLIGQSGVYSAPNSPAKATAKAPANPIPEMEMISIPAGSFMMGNTKVGDDSKYQRADELPQHSVYLSAYSIGKYEVTRAQYQKFIDAAGYANQALWSSDGWKWKTEVNRTQPAYYAPEQEWEPGRKSTQTDNYPVVGLTYYEAEAFCKWAGGHLPTEAQWEKAARWDEKNKHSNVYPWGDTWDADKCNNMYDHNEAGGGYLRWQTAPVGSYPAGASAYGCQDMAGNAGEWCSDKYADNYYAQKPKGGWKDPQGPAAYYPVVRGGGWYGNDNYSRCSFRDYLHPNPFYSYSYGFRLVRDAKPKR